VVAASLKNKLPPAFASYEPHHDPEHSTGQQIVTKTTHKVDQAQ